MQALLLHHLKMNTSTKDVARLRNRLFLASQAVSQLMETVFRGLGPSQASLLRLFLLLESREQGQKEASEPLFESRFELLVALFDQRGDQQGRAGPQDGGRAS